MYIPSCGWRVYRTEIWECEKMLVRRGHTSILSQETILARRVHTSILARRVHTSILARRRQTSIPARRRQTSILARREHIWTLCQHGREYLNR
jgi:hypothetical protein